MRSRLRQFALLLAACACAAQVAHGAATITIVNGDPAGVGFNDPTVVAPVGGNAGTTLGQQRLNAFQSAANIWGATLTSTVPITILATFEALTCTATSAVLGSAGATNVFSDFPGATFAATWYPYALSNKLLGVDALAPTPSAQIRARFNVNLGQPTCLAGTPFYLGLDNLHGTSVDLVAVLLHEFGHGLGFQTFTNGSTGAFLASQPSVWDHFLFDRTASLTWAAMTDPQRATSAINTGGLVWTGANAVAAVPTVLQAGLPNLVVSAPASVAGTYQVGTASFGPALSSPGVTAEVMPVVDNALGTGLACVALSAANAAAVNGKIALVDRGTCTFNIKAQVVQAAGAVGMIVADNTAGSPPAGLGGTDPTITIPSVRITLADGNTLKNTLRFRSRTHSGMFATLGLDLSVRAFADSSNRPFLYTPNPYQGGSSVSHWDTRMTPNQLMEPAINADLTHSVVTPQDLTFELLKDIGW
jgi:hypothetical protein